MPRPTTATRDRRCQREDCGRRFKASRTDSPAKYCPACRPKMFAASMRDQWAKRKKYRWTPELDELLRSRYSSKVRGRTKELAVQIGWPDWVIKKRAAALGIAGHWPANRRDWTEHEEAFLQDRAGHFSVHWIAGKLGRTETQVVLKLKRMQISRRLTDGYTMRELELCFGVDHRVIKRWMDKGWLKERRRDEPNDSPTRRSMCVTDSDILDFIKNHPTDFVLRRVDQVWFMDLILAGDVMRRAMAAATDPPDDQEEENDRRPAGLAGAHA